MFELFQNLRREYNLNSKRIWKGVGIIILVIFLIRFIDIAMSKKGDSQDETQEDTVVNSVEYAVASETNVEPEVSQKTVEIIDSFMGYCNNGQVEQAYMLLSDKCKEKTYPTLEIFRDVFWKGNFQTKKEYSIQAWMYYTYRVKIFDDMLETGISTTSNPTTENYMTIVGENDEIKLNLNGYIGTVDLNKETEQYNIKIKAIEKDVYMNYEIYKFEVTNTLGRSIKLDTKENISSVNIKNSNGVIFTSNIGEFGDNDLIIPDGTTKQIQIKFDNNYKTNNNIEKINFSKIQLDVNDKRITEKISIEL